MGVMVKTHYHEAVQMKMKTSQLVEAALFGSMIAFCCGFGKAIADTGASPESVRQLPTKQVAAKNQSTEAVGIVQGVVQTTLVLAFTLNTAKILKN